MQRRALQNPGDQADFFPEPRQSQCKIRHQKLFGGTSTMNLDRLLIASVLCLSAGLGVIFGYCNGTIGANAGWPLAACSLQISVTTTGPGALGGLVLTVLGVLLLICATLVAIIHQFKSGAARKAVP